MDWFQIGKEYVKAVYCHLTYLTYAEYIMWNAGLNEAQAKIKLVLQKSLEIPLDNKGNQFCMFIGRTDVEVETPILWPPNAKKIESRRKRGQQRMR